MILNVWQILGLAFVGMGYGVVLGYVLARRVEVVATSDRPPTSDARRVIDRERAAFRGGACWAWRRAASGNRRLTEYAEAERLYPYPAAPAPEGRADA